MMRRFSTSFGSNRRAKKQANSDYWAAQKKLNDDLAAMTQSLVAKIDSQNAQVDDRANPETRLGMSLFSAKTSSDDERGQDLDRVLYEMPQPENVDAMTDLLKLHENGDKFPYIGIVGQEGETLDARRARLLALKPSIGLRSIPEIQVMACPLIDTEGQFNMNTLMLFATKSSDPVQPQTGIMPKTNTMKDFSITKKYVHIRSVTGLYTPNMSSTADFCKLWFVLVDSRLINSSKSGQSNALVSNQEGVMELSCDYCVHVSDMEYFVLGYTLEREILKPGHQWGTITFYFNITESDIPFQTAKRDALAVYRMPISTLVERKTNADRSDISFTSSDVAAMRRLYLSGDIVDVDQPQQARMKKSTYSKTTLRGAVKGEEIEGEISKREGWEFMQGARKPMVSADIASVDQENSGPSEDDVVYSSTPKEDWEREQEKMREMQQGLNMEPRVQLHTETEDPVVPKKVVIKSSLDDLFANNKKGVKFDETNV